MIEGSDCSIGGANITPAWADEFVVFRVFENVTHPTADARHRENRRVHVDRDAQFVVDRSREEVEIGCDPFLGETFLLGEIRLDGGCVIEPFGGAVFGGEALKPGSEYFRTGMFSCVDAVTPPRNALASLGLGFDPLTRTHITVVEVRQRLHDVLVGAAVQRP